MAKKKSNLTSFFTTSPLQTGAGILVIISVLLNVGTLLFVVLINHTTAFDHALAAYSQNKICYKDYDTLQSQFFAKVANPEQSRKLFDAVTCFRDAKTGKALDYSLVQPVKD